MKLTDAQMASIADAAIDDRRVELHVRLVERGKLGDVDAAATRAEIDRLFQLSVSAGITDAHECARLVELFFLLSPEAKASPTCDVVILGVLVNVFASATQRVDFLYRHVLTKTDWPDVDPSKLAR